MAVQTKILHRRDTAANWTSTNPTLSAGEIGFETDTLKFKIGNGSTAWTSLTYQSDASLLSGAASLTTLTTSGNVTIGGDLTVNGTTTSINSSTLQVDDKNLELSSVAVITGKTGTATTSSSTITASNTVGMIVGQTITKTAGTATLTSTTVASIVNATAFTLTNPVASGGTLTFDTSGATDASADGAGITVLGSTNKTLNYVNANTAWTSSENFDLASGKTYKINSTTVLSGTQVLGYSIATANTASTIVARDASGNFAAGTITASLTGTASLASNLTGGTANKGQIVYQSGANTTSQLTATTTNNQVLAYDTSANAPYWAAITGTGSVVLATSPTLVTPALGTPSSGNLASTTGYATANLTGAGTNVLTFLATPTSANFLNTVTGATGNGGGVVFANNATLVAPTLGVASATSLNKVTVTAPATSATLTLADGSTLATSGAFSVTLTGTATTNVTLPTTGTLATQTYVGSATVAQANNLTGTTPNLIPYQSASNTTTFLAAPAGNQYVLTANTTGAPYWAAPAASGVTSLVAGNGITVSGSTGAVTVNTNAAYATTWTTTQQVNVSTDVIAFAVKGNTTQTANLIEAKNNGGTMMMSLSPTGTLFAVTIDGGSA